MSHRTAIASEQLAALVMARPGFPFGPCSNFSDEAAAHNRRSVVKAAVLLADELLAELEEKKV
jgi:hypothetical protein